MLKLNLKRIAGLRGVTNIPRFMRNNGFSYSVIERYSRGLMVFFKLEHIEKLCLLFNCTPDDLLEWQPDDGNFNNNIPLKKLQTGESESISELVKNIPLNKYGELKKAISEISD